MHQILRDVLVSLAHGVRLSVFGRPPIHAASPHPAALLTLALLWLAAVAAFQALIGGERLTFNPYGLSASLAGLALLGAVVVVIGAGNIRMPLTRSLATILAVEIVLLVAAAAVLQAQTNLGSLPPALASHQDDISIVLLALPLVWAVAALLWTGRALWREQLRLPGVRLATAALLPMVLVPMPPIIHGSTTDWTRRDVWHLADQGRKWLTGSTATAARSKRPPPIDVEAVYYRQPSLVKAAIDALKPSPSDKPQMYFVGAAAYSGQDVFKRELTGARSVFDQHFGTAGRSIALVNYRDTLEQLPLANASNLSLVLDGVGKSMRTDKDILVLFITTHGTRGLLAVDFPGFSLNNLTPQRLAAMLDRSGIRHRIVIISACHSGSFIPALSNRDTLIMTAAHAEKTSFGCESGRDWTYFGDALFNRGLRSTRSFTAAFAQAKALISEWEKKDELEPSEPQMVIGAAIAKRLSEMSAM